MKKILFFSLFFLIFSNVSSASKQSTEKETSVPVQYRDPLGRKALRDTIESHEHIMSGLQAELNIINDQLKRAELPQKEKDDLNAQVSPLEKKINDKMIDLKSEQKMWNDLVKNYPWQTSTCHSIKIGGTNNFPASH